MKILVTGANGFVGGALVSLLAEQNEYVINAANRNGDRVENATAVFGKNVVENTNWSDALTGVTHVIHAAARVHVLRDHVKEPLEAFREVNVRGTLNLARQAVDAGVKRFIFISSIGVNGAQTNGKPFQEADVPNPHSDYAISKWEAEQGLFDIARKSDLEVVVLRPPLIYARNAPGRFGQLLKLVSYNLPLPLGAINNKRSLISLSNLISFIRLALLHPEAANQIFLIADNESLSTKEIVKSIADAENKRLILLPIPASWIFMLAKILGKQSAAEGLIGSLEIDAGKAKSLLGWKAEVSMAEQLKMSKG